MKAFLLAAGLGTRLRPYTLTTPKCLMQIDGKPLLQIWLELLAAHGIDQVLINTHWLADAVESFLTAYRKQTQVEIFTAFEAQLLGSAGTVWQNRSFVDDQQDFLIIYADNLTQANLSQLVAVHRRASAQPAVMTIGVFRATHPERCGIVVTDEFNQVIDFVEKPDRPMGNLANAGIYVASHALFDTLAPLCDADGFKPIDFGHHVLPALAGHMRIFEIDAYLIDIGSIESYQQAALEWPQQQGALA